MGEHGEEKEIVESKWMVQESSEDAPFFTDIDGRGGDQAQDSGAHP